MANTKISALTSATTPLAGTEVIPVVQSGVTVKATVQDVLSSTQPSGTANGVMYLNASKVTTTGANITYDGTTFKLNSSAPVISLQGTNGTGYTCQIISSGSNSDTLQINSKAFYINSDTYNFRNTATTTTYGSINTAGNFTLNIGNFIQGTSGKGLTTSGSFALGLGTNGSTTQATLDTNGTLTVGSSGSSQADLIHLVNNGGQNIEMYYAAAAKTTWHTGVNTSSSFYIGKDGNAYKFTIADDGTASVVSNNLSFGTAAKGVNFTANTPAAGMTSQLLNWYEEGTWTPADASGAGLTFTSVTAKYTRIGRQVTATVVLTYPTTASTAQAQISGLPFAASNMGQFLGIRTGVAGASSGLVSAGGSTIVLYTQAGASQTNVTNSTATLYLTGTYFV